jgi:hypothetical protein
MVAEGMGAGGRPALGALGPTRPSGALPPEELERRVALMEQRATEGRCLWTGEPAAPVLGLRDLVRLFVRDLAPELQAEHAEHERLVDQVTREHLRAWRRARDEARLPEAQAALRRHVDRVPPDDVQVARGGPGAGPERGSEGRGGGRLDGLRTLHGRRTFPLGLVGLVGGDGSDQASGGDGPGAGVGDGLAADGKASSEADAAQEVHRAAP